MHAYLIVSIEAIQKTIHLVPRYSFEYAIRERERKGICDHDRVKLPAVDTNADLLVLLWYNYNRTQPCGLLDWPDETDFRSLLVSSFTRAT